MDDASIAGPNHAAGIFLECFSYFWHLLRCTYAAEGPKLGYAGLLLWFNRELGSLVQARVTGVATLRFATSGETPLWQATAVSPHLSARQHFNHCGSPEGPLVVACLGVYIRQAAVTVQSTHEAARTSFTSLHSVQ
jgi:hypothetical protein